MAIDKPDTRRFFDPYLNQIEDERLQEIFYDLTQRLEEIFIYYDSMLDFYKTSYVLDWPERSPVAGETLEVESVNGRTVKLKWS